MTGRVSRAAFKEATAVSIELLLKLSAAAPTFIDGVGRRFLVPLCAFQLRVCAAALPKSSHKAAQSFGGREGCRD